MIIATVMGIALALSAWTAARVVFTSGNRAASAPSASRDRRAEGLLRDAADAARTVFMQRGTYEKITPAQVADRARDTTIVAAGTVARSGQVSIRAAGEDVLILATPAAGKTCAFARDEPAQSEVSFATTRTKTCTATAAPRSGWSSG